MSEKKDYKKFKDNVFKPLDRVDRIENILVTGMFDVNYCVEGTEGWVEIKSPKEPVRATTPLFGSNHKVSQEQMNWALRQTNAGGICYFLIVTDKRWLLVHGKFADKINSLTVEGLISIAHWHVESSALDKSSWSMLRLCLGYRRQQRVR